MAYFLVAVLAVLVGAGAYAATMRRGAGVAVGFEGGTGADEPDGPGTGYTYLRVGIRGPSWQERLLGVVGLLVLVALSAVVLAVGIYQLGHIVNVTIENFLAD